MASISARNLRDSLQKAKRVGLVEEKFTIDDCEVVVRNLRPDEYEAIIAQCNGLEDIAYLNMFQMGHVCRAIVELNGQDLRDADFIDDEEPDPKRPGQTKAVKMELHAWISKNIVSTWSKEAVYTAYRKVTDVVEKAEKKAKEGVEFLVPDETTEDKFRRLVGEMSDLEEDLPGQLIDRILDQYGLMRKSTAEELKRAMEHMDALARETIGKEKAEAKAREEAIQVAPPAPTSESVSPPLPVRQPMNRIAVDVPTPPHTAHQAPVPATRQTMQGTIPGPTVTGSAAARSAHHAALEADADAAGIFAGQGETADPPVKRPAPDEIPVFTGLSRQDPKVIASITDQPPVVGLNPHFRRPPV